MAPVVDETMAPPNIQVLIAGTCKCYLKWQQGFCRCDYIKDLEMGILSWMFGPKCDCEDPHRRCDS